MVRKRQRKQRQFYLDLFPEVEKIKGEHPYWGYRRITSFLKKHVNPRVNHKGILLLLKNNGLLVPRHRKLRACRTNSGKQKPITDMPNEIWGTDMTKTWTRQGWCYIHVVLDWGTKKLLAALASAQSRTADWIAAMDHAINFQFPDGIDPEEAHYMLPSIVSDNGCQPTSKAYATFLKTLNLKHLRTSFCNPKGDADTERVIRTMKEDLFWTHEFESIEEVQAALDKWCYNYNTVFPHSSLCNCTPVEYENLWNCGKAPKFTRATKIIEQRLATSLIC